MSGNNGESLPSAMTRRPNPVANSSKTGERKDEKSNFRSRDRVRGPGVERGDMGGYPRGRIGYEAAIGNCDMTAKSSSDPPVCDSGEGNDEKSGFRVGNMARSIDLPINVLPEVRDRKSVVFVLGKICTRQTFTS